jgi:phosphoribosylanthranilate isomerase
MKGTQCTRTRVKVCGLTRAVDARAAVLAGADALGVILVPGARRGVSLSEAADVFGPVPPLVTRVGVFVDATPGQVAEAVSALGLHAVQLSGSESPQLCASMPVPVIKAFHVGPGFDARAIAAYQGTIALALLDTALAGVHGGTGRTFDWGIVRSMCVGVPVMLAGGLNPGNVGDAILQARPYAVDVSSGVEAASREKDPGLVAAFLAAVRAADAASEQTRNEGTDE